MISTKRPLPADVDAGNRVRMRRKMLGISQSALAERLGITFQQVQKYENGRNRMSASRLQQLAIVLGVRPEFFFETTRIAGEDSETAAINKFIASTDGLNLMQAFGRIRSRKLRRALVDFMEELARPHAS